MSQLYKYQFKINYFYYFDVKLIKYKCLQVEIINFNGYFFLYYIKQMGISFYITLYKLQNQLKLTFKKK